MEAVIFDMDGIIIDSQAIADKLIAKTANKIGVHLTENELHRLRGASGYDVWLYIKNTYNLPLSVDEYKAQYSEDEEIAEYKFMKPIKGIPELIFDLKNHDILLALATSASAKRMDAVLTLFNLRDTFNAVTSVNEVSQAKPNPEIYLITARKLNTGPNECVVIEDSLKGILAAKNAGMKSVYYQNSNTVEKDKINADLIINDFNNLSFNILNLL